MATRGSRMVKYSSKQYVFLSVMCDSELISYEKSLCQELVQTFSWVHFPAGERKRPTENRKHRRPRETLLRPAIIFFSEGDKGYGVQSYNRSSQFSGDC